MPKSCLSKCLWIIMTWHFWGLILFYFLWKWQCTTGHHTERDSKVLGWRSRLKQQLIFNTSTPSQACCRCRDKDMVMRSINRVALGKLSSSLEVWAASVCVCPAALLATVTITEQRQAAEQDTHQLDLHAPSSRLGVCANETRIQREKWNKGEGRWGMKRLITQVSSQERFICKVK